MFAGPSPISTPAAAANIGDAGTWVGVAVALVIGLAGVAVGVIGIVQARGARSEAVKANSAADEANRVANAALVGDDVWWSLAWHGTGVAELINQGHDDVTNVRGRVTVDDETVIFGPVDHLSGQGGIDLQFPGARVALALERQRLEGDEDPFKLGYSTDAVPNHTVSWRVTWNTPLGRTMPLDAQSFSEQGITPVSTTPPGVD